MDEILKLQKAIENYKKGGMIEPGLTRALVQVEKEIEHIIFLNSRNKTITQKGSRKVQFGVAGNYLEDFINIDMKEPADLLCDVRKGIPLKSEGFDFIFSEHFLEHLDYPFSVNLFIKECHRILSHNGKIIIGVPDTRKVIEMYQNSNTALFNYFLNNWYSKRTIKSQLTSLLDIVNIHMRDESDSYKYSPHLWSYDFEKLSELLTENNFKDIKNWKIEEKICNSKRIKYTLYVEARK